MDSITECHNCRKKRSKRKFIILSRRTPFTFLLPINARYLRSIRDEQDLENEMLEIDSHTLAHLLTYFHSLTFPVIKIRETCAVSCSTKSQTHLFVAVCALKMCNSQTFRVISGNFQIFTIFEPKNFATHTRTHPAVFTHPSGISDKEVGK